MLLVCSPSEDAKVANKIDKGFIRKENTLDTLFLPEMPFEALKLRETETELADALTKSYDLIILTARNPDQVPTEVISKLELYKDTLIVSGPFVYMDGALNVIAQDNPHHVLGKVLKDIIHSKEILGTLNVDPRLTRNKPIDRVLPLRTGDAKPYLVNKFQQKLTHVFYGGLHIHGGSPSIIMSGSDSVNSQR